MRTSLKSLVVLAALSMPGVTLAQSTTAADLTQLEAETTLLKARARKLDVQAQIAARQAEIGRLTAIPVSSGPITVRAIEGIGGTVYATLQLAGGDTVDAKAGDVLSNGLKVLSIGRGAVMVQRKRGKPYRLAGAEPAARQAPPAPSASAPATPALHLPLIPPPPAPPRGVR